MRIITDVPPILNDKQCVAIDTEFFGQDRTRLHRPHGRFASAQFYLGGDEVYIVNTLPQLKVAFSNIQQAVWIFQTASYDLTQLRRLIDLPYNKDIWDTELVERFLYGGYYQEFSLKALCRRYLGEWMSKEVRTEFATATTMTPEMMEYAADDVVILWRVWEEQKKVADYRDMLGYWEIDMPMIWVAMDFKPVKIDKVAWQTSVMEFEKAATELESELGINTMSPKQLIPWIEKKLKLRSHLLNTKAETLERFLGNPYIDKVLKTRMYRKAKSTYGLNWIAKSVEEGDLVYAHWHITGAETGRMSCSNPGLQQIPVRKLPIYRTFFITNEGMITVADISQQEPRILAYESQDKRLIAAFDSKEDIHLAVTRSIFNDDSIGKEDVRRKLGKAINLGTSYGLTPTGLAARTTLSQNEAEQFIEQYFKRFPGVRAYIDKQRRFAKANGYVQTSAGRRIWINHYSRQADNNAINGTIQGGGADFTKLWTVKIWDTCRVRKVEFPISMIIHDELVSDHIREMQQAYADMLTETMHSTAAALYPGIPFESEIVHGQSWGCKK